MNEKKFRMKVVRRAGKARSERVRAQGRSVLSPSPVSQLAEVVRESAASPSPQLAVYQSTGGSRDGVMSQAAVTEALRSLASRIGNANEIRMGWYGEGATTGVRYRFWLDPGINLDDTISVSVRMGDEVSVNESFLLREMYESGETNAELLELCLLNCESYDVLVEDCLLRRMVSDGAYLYLEFDSDSWGAYADVTIEGLGPGDVEKTEEEETGADFWSVAAGRGDLIDGRRHEGVLYIDKGAWKVYTWNVYEHRYEVLGGGDVAIDEELDDESLNPVQNRAIAEALSAYASAVSGLASTLNGVSRSLSGMGDELDSIGRSIDSLQSNVSTNQGAIDSLDGRVQSLEESQTGGKWKKALGDEDGTNIKANYLKKSEANSKYVRYDASQSLDATQRGRARTNIDSENLVVGYLARGFTTNIYFTDLDGGSPRNGTVVVTANGNNALCTVDYTNKDGNQVITYIAECINALNGYSATANLVTGTNAYHAVITVTCNGNPVTGLQFRSGFTGYVFNIETTGAAAGFYADANYSTLVTNTYVARKLYLDLNSNQLYCGNENELQSVAGSPVVDASYDSVNEKLTLTFLGDKSVEIPFSMPVLSAGKGIAINGNTISQNYVVCTESELAEYLAQGIDDGLIRYVYEEE